MNHKQKMQTVLDAFGAIASVRLGWASDIKTAISILKDELAKPEDEPVGKVVSSGPADFPIFQWISADHSLRCKTGDLLYLRPQSCECCKQPTFTTTPPVPVKPVEVYPFSNAGLA
jgi:hypothetical protein